MPWFVIAIIVAALLLAAMRIFEVRAEVRDRSRIPSGRLSGPEGERLHIRIKGTSPGPGVVIEQGAGGVGPLWWAVQDEIAEFATVITYDRLGLGWSDAPSSPLNLDDHVERLHGLLETEKVPKPYILVGHSYGGLLVRHFARRYPDDTAGLVLVDTLEEGSFFQPDVLKLYSRFCALLTVIAGVHALGVPRLVKKILPGKGAEPDSRDAAMEELQLRPEMYKGMRDDFRYLCHLDSGRREPWAPGCFGRLPLTVITHGQPFPGPVGVLEKYWEDGQRRLAALSDEGAFIVAQNSNHMIQDDEPRIVIDAIRGARNAAMERRQQS